MRTEDKWKIAYGSMEEYGLETWRVRWVELPHQPVRSSVGG